MTQGCSLPSAPFATPCSRRRCPLDLPGADGRAGRAQGSLLKQLDDYVLPRLRVAGRAAARRRRRLDRRRQVHAGQLHRRRDGEPQRRAAPDHPLAGAGAPPRRRRLVHRRAGPARPGPGHRRRRPAERPDDPGDRCGWSRRPRCPRGWPCSTPPTSTRSSSANRELAAPAARRRRPLAVRHHRRALRRRRAVGPAARGRRARHVAWRSCSTGCRRRRSTEIRSHLAVDAARAGPGDGADLRRPRDRRSTPRAGCPTDDVARLRSWLHGARPRRQGPRRSSSGDPRPAPCDSLDRRGRPALVDAGAGAGRRRSTALRDGGRRVRTRDAAGASTRA